MSANVTIDSRALVSWDEYRNFLGKNSDVDEPNLGNTLINQATDLIETFLRRKVKARKYRNEIHRATDIIVVRQNPLIHWYSIYDGVDYKTTTGSATASGTTASLVGSALTEANDYWNGAVVSVETSTDVWEKANVNDFVASTDTLSWDSAEAFSTATQSGMAYRLSHQYTGNYTALSQADIKDIDFESGIIRLWGTYGVLAVTYQAGWVTVPDDIKYACMLQIKAMDTARSMAGVQSAQFGGNTFTPFPDKTFKHIVPEAEALLHAYRRPMI